MRRHPRGQGDQEIETHNEEDGTSIDFTLASENRKHEKDSPSCSTESYRV